ncbi:MAG: NADH-quinone oxidoreductase subunit L [Kineosporiaceae bacterium]
MSTAAALLTLAVPGSAALFGLFAARGRVAAQEWGVLGALGALVAAIAELVGVLSDGDTVRMAFLGRVDLAPGTGTGVWLDLRSDQLSALMAVVVGLVAFCVQVYSRGYLHSDGTPEAPTRYKAYAATVSLFTTAMMLVVHADDLVVLLIGWELMGLCSYLLVGHHSERATARAAAIKAFLVTRVGDVGVLLAVVVLLVDARTTSISRLLERAAAGEISTTTATAATLLLLGGVAGKSAQFPLHMWLPDAMEGPTPVSALIHAATMVAAGVFLVVRLYPLFLVADASLDVAAVMAAVTMLGAALAACAQEDVKRLLAWSTISQVAFMLAGAAVDREHGGAAGFAHLLAHAGFKALLFLLAGVVVHLAGTTSFSGLGGLRRAHPWLSAALAVGLLSLAGIPPFSGFWTKESVIGAAEHAAEDGSWSAWVVFAAALTTTVLTGWYAARCWCLLTLPRPEPVREVDGGEHEEHLPRSMTWPLALLAVPSVGFGLVLVWRPSVLDGVTVSPQTGFVGALLSLAGVGWALSAPRLGSRDPADLVPARTRAFLRDGYRIDAAVDVVVVRPVVALARLVATGDRDVVDAYVRGLARASGWGGLVARRLSVGVSTVYAGLAVAGAVVLGVLGVVLA